ncbi:CHAT domain-containing protein [Frankia sp. Cj3]|uniref:CHAT domain-containing protein n=1 Tax=Frankia sp. Cj3 TaxID=2880976 RepID=UPI001EF4A877|nr:CHAT domain-containing protein [Frankia sp. Cj3]
MPALEVPVREIGQQLFTALVGGPVYGRYAAATETAQQNGELLRVVLRLRAPELAALPWEMLFDPESGGYLCQYEPLIRHLPVPTPGAPVIKPPLRVLGLVTAPRDLAALDTDGEKARLSEALTDLGGRVHLEWAPGARWEDLQHILLQGPWHAVHFIGHGGFDQTAGEGTIALEGADHRANWVSAHRLRQLLSIQTPAPRLIVLNSCASGQAAVDDLFSSTAAALVRSGVSAAVAMQFAVSDPAAKAFAAGFYQAIATNRSISEAVRVGRIGIAGANATTLEWATPVLYLRGEHGQDSSLFTVTDTVASTRQQDAPSAERAAQTAAVRALYQQAMAKFRTGHYDQALPLFDSLLTLDVHFADAAERHKDCHTRQRATAAYQAADAAEQAGDWPTAIRSYTALLELDPGHSGALRRREQCRTRQHIADLQNELRLHYEAGDWAAALAVDHDIAAIDPAAANPNGLATQAHRQMAAKALEPPTTPPTTAPTTRQHIADLQNELRVHYEAGDWAAALAVDHDIAAIDPAAANPNGLATQAHRQMAAKALEPPTTPPTAAPTWKRFLPIHPLNSRATAIFRHLFHISLFALFVMVIVTISDATTDATSHVPSDLLTLIVLVGISATLRFLVGSNANVQKGSEKQ